MKLSIDDVIQISLTAIYKEDTFNQNLYLKGGQAIRLLENIRTRFSADIDFSVQNKINDQDEFFNQIKDTLYIEFSNNELHLFDFNFTRKPKVKSEGTPDFWGGWQVEFKLIYDSKKFKKLEIQRREALIPSGCQSSIINIDISEYEYCNSIETVKLETVIVKTYSRTLIVLEKIRAICQQHPTYILKGNDSRARDFYDIEKLWQKVLREKNQVVFINECRKHIGHVFKAKEVPLDIMEFIFEETFIELQKQAWETVKNSVSERIDDFEYYVENLKQIINLIKQEELK